VLSQSYTAQRKLTSRSSLTITGISIDRDLVPSTLDSTKMRLTSRRVTCLSPPHRSLNSSLREPVTTHWTLTTSFQRLKFAQLRLLSLFVMLWISMISTRQDPRLTLWLAEKLATWWKSMTLQAHALNRDINPGVTPAVSLPMTTLMLRKSKENRNAAPTHLTPPTVTWTKMAKPWKLVSLPVPNQLRCQSPPRIALISAEVFRLLILQAHRHLPRA